MTARRLIGLSHSPWTIKARWALDHHGIAYEYEEHVPMLGEPVLRARMGWPRGTITVPVLLEGGVVLRESIDIAQHAERLSRAERLFPEGREAEVIHWNGLADVISRAGRALLVPRIAKSPRALEESLPRRIPSAVRRIATPAARSALRYLARKYEVREEESELDRGTIRWTLRKLREQLERGDHVLGTWSYADVAIVSALQVVRPCAELVRMGEATAEAWTDETLAREHEDLLAWRDRMVARHRPRPGAPISAAGAAAPRDRRG